MNKRDKAEVFQEQVYIELEADQFFDRTLAGFGGDFPSELRPLKKEILDQILKVSDISGARVLEIGPFIGDLLHVMKTDFACSVTGVEPSTKAVNYCRDVFGIELENVVFSQSKLLQAERALFDLIIVDDVLSWMSRQEILSVMAAIDRLLAPDGLVHIRDYDPWQAFAYENHHVPGRGVLSFKQPGGHKQFLIQTGLYAQVFSWTRSTGEFQVIETKDPDSKVWNDSIVKKLTKPMHAIRSLK